MAGPHLQQPSFLLVGGERRAATGEAPRRARGAVPSGAGGSSRFGWACGYWLTVSFVMCL